MKKLSLLKEYIKLIMEAQQAPFSFPEPLTPGVAPRRRHSSDQYTITREFPLVPTPEIMQLLKLTPDDASEDGAMWAENEILIEVTDMYHEREERMTREHPGNPEGYLIEGWVAVAFHGVALSPGNAKALQDYMGDLTEEESQSIIEQYVDSHEPDFDDGGYDPY